MYLSTIILDRIIQDLYATHQLVANIDEKALWQHRGKRIFILSETVKLQNSIPAQLSYNVGDELPVTFRCRASKRHFDTKRNKRVETFCPTSEMKDKITTWGEVNGFVMGEASFGNEDPFPLTKTGAYLTSLYVVGTLTVTDTTKFETVLKSGIGQSKRLGFGLLNVWV